MLVGGVALLCRRHIRVPINALPSVRPSAHLPASPLLLTYRCLNDTAPHYLAETIRPVSSRGTRQHLRSAETSILLVLSTRRSTLGDRSFPVAAARAWNALSQHVQNAPSLVVFRRELKTVLFRSSFPDAI